MHLPLERQGVDANSKDKCDWTTLSIAAAKEHRAVVQLLLKHTGVDADSEDNYGRTLLWEAATNGHREVV